jgi:hypothetical protein
VAFFEQSRKRAIPGTDSVHSSAHPATFSLFGRLFCLFKMCTARPGKKRPSPRKRDHVEPGVAVNCNEKSPKTAHKLKVLGFCHFLRFGAAGVVSTAV